MMDITRFLAHLEYEKKDGKLVKPSVLFEIDGEVVGVGEDVSFRYVKYEYEPVGKTVVDVLGKGTYTLEPQAVDRISDNKTRISLFLVDEVRNDEKI